MDKAELTKIVFEVEKENSLFVKKVHLDTLTFPSKIIGRKDQVKELVSFLAYKQGLVVPFIAVYGRSGSGKSTIAKFVSLLMPLVRLTANNSSAVESAQ